MTTPSAQIIAAAAETLQVTDAQNRKIEVRRLNALERLRLFKAVGPVLAQNSAYLGMATLAASVIAIDGVPVPAPGNEAHIEALVARLGDAGIAAVAPALTRLGGQNEGTTNPGN